VQSGFDIDITPSVTTYELYQNMSYTHWFAIGEFIDNSITSAYLNWDELNSLYDGKFELKINIDFDYKEKTLTITDNACGIARNDIERALTAGETPYDKSMLSVHGVGMKMSSFWLGRNLKIITSPINSKEGFHAEVDLDEIKRTKSAKSRVEELRPSKMPGTIIRISRIKEDKIPKGTGILKIKLLLTSMYRIYLNSKEKKVHINFNGKPLIFKELSILTEPFWDDREGPQDDAVIRWERNFEYVFTDGKKITGRVGLLETMSRDLSGFMLHYKGKGMGGIGSMDASSEISQQDVRDAREYYRPPRIFGQEGSYRFQRFTGEFDISDLGKTSSTDSIKWGAGEDEAEFIEALIEFLKDPKFNMWAMAENFAAKTALRLKKGEAKSGSASFTVDEVVSISDYFSNSIHGESITHSSDSDDTVKTPNPRSLSSVPSNEFSESEGGFKVPDASNHEHIFTSHFIDSPDFDLYTLESIDSDKHIIRINVGHPFIRRLQWGNPDVREAVIQMIFLMSVPEVFLPLRNSKSAFRAKINEIVDATLSRLIVGKGKK
jgi:hypothetical protein